MSVTIPKKASDSNFPKGLEDQHMEWKPAGQPEHASLNQCQLIGALGTPSRWWR